MKPHFSEFSYGFALTREICARQWGGLQAAPVFPSLIEEGRLGGGYDVRIEQPGFPLYLQFKLSEYMSRSSAKEWDCFGSGYYRFRIRSNQHQLLCQLDSGPDNIVLYAAPVVWRIDDWNCAFINESVVQNSAFFRPRDIKSVVQNSASFRPRDIGAINDQDAHRVAFLAGGRFGYLFSEPKKIPLYASGDVVFEKMMETHDSKEFHEPTEDYFRKISRAIREVFRIDDSQRLRSIMDREDLDGTKSAQWEAAYLVRMLLNAELLWVARSDGPGEMEATAR